MTEETQVETPIADAPIADSSPAPEVEAVKTPETPNDAGSEQGEDGKALSERVQKRIDELTREKYERAREADYWRQQAMQQKPPEPPPVATKLPTLEEVGYDESKYQAALIEFATKQAERVVEERLSRADKERAEQTRLASFVERQRAFAKATPDFEAKVLQDPTLPITEGMRDVIVDSDSGPELAYYLAQNRGVAEQIARLPAHLAALELGRIEGRLSVQKEAAKRPVVSKAPPPPPTVDSSDSDVGDIKASDPESDKLSTDDWRKRREKELRRKR